VKPEELFEYMENDRNFTQIDPFKEFVSGLDNMGVYALLAMLEVYIDTSIAEWDTIKIAKPRLDSWMQIVMNEYTSRQVTLEEVIEEERGRLAEHVANCDVCYDGWIYGLKPEDGPEDSCGNCYKERETLALYNDFVLNRYTRQG
jgi:hypothetical protein